MPETTTVLYLSAESKEIAKHLTDALRRNTAALLGESPYEPEPEICVICDKTIVPEQAKFTLHMPLGTLYATEPVCGRCAREHVEPALQKAKNIRPQSELLRQFKELATDV